MNEMTVKNQTPAIALAVLMLGGGGVNILSEGKEEAAIEALESRLVAADVVQDRNYADLLQRYNDLNTLVRLLEQRVGQ